MTWREKLLVAIAGVFLGIGIPWTFLILAGVGKQ